MLNVTTAFNEAFKSDLREVKMRIKINDVTYTDEDIVSFNYNAGSIVGESFAIGSTFANTVRLTLCRIVEGLKQLDEVIPEMGIVLPDESIEWVKLGTFIISEEVNPDRNENRTSLECTDKMIMLDDIYESKLKYPARIRDVALEIANLAGVEIEQVSFGRLMVNTIQKPVGYTYRQALGLIAQFEAGYVCFDRNGLLAIKQLEDKNYQVTPNEYFLKGLTKNELMFRPAGIQVKVNSDTEEDKVLKIGNEKGSVIHLENKVMTDGLLKLVYDKVKNINYYPYTLKWRGNPAVEVGDWLQVTDTKGNLFKVPNLSYSFEYKGGLTAASTVETVASNEVRFGYKGILDQTVEYVENALKDVGGNLIYYGVEAPPNPKEGDTWFKYVDSDTEIWVYEKVGEPDVFDWVFKISSAVDNTIKEKIDELEQQSKDQQINIDKALSDAEKAREEAKKARDEAFDSSVIAKQAEKDALDALLKGDQNSTQITTLEGQQKLTNTKVEGNTANILNLQADSEKLSLSIGKVQADVDGINVGGDNLVINSEFLNRDNWATGTSTLQEKGYMGIRNSIKLTVSDNHSSSHYSDVMSQLLYKEGEIPNRLRNQTEYILSFMARSNVKGKQLYSYVYANRNDSNYKQIVDGIPFEAPASDTKAIYNLNSEWTRHYCVFKTNSGLPTNILSTTLLFRTFDTSCEIEIAEVMLTEGNKLKSWERSSMDTVTLSEFATFEASTQGFQSTVNSQISGLESQQTQMAGQISSTVETLNNIGSDNLLLNTSNFENLSNWQYKSSTNGDGKITLTKHAFYENGQRNTIELQNRGSGENYLISDRVILKRNSYYTIQFKGFASSNVRDCDVFMLTRPKGSSKDYESVIAIKSLFKMSPSRVDTYTYTFKTGSEADEGYIRFDNNGSTNTGQSSAFFTEITVVEGKAVTGYAPSSKENASKSEVIQLSDQITQTVNKVETVDGKVTQQQSQITQLSNNISLKVDKDNAIAQINLSPESIRLDAKFIHLSGTSKIDDAIITNAMIKDVSADKMTVGTLNGANVNIVNLNANNIITGTLTGITLTGNTINGGTINNAYFYNTGARGTVRINNGGISALEFWTEDNGAFMSENGYAILRSGGKKSSDHVFLQASTEVRATRVRTFDEYIPIKASSFYAQSSSFQGYNNTTFSTEWGYVTLRSYNNAIYLQAKTEVKATKPSDPETYVPVRASSFPSGSLERFKTNIQEYKADALELIDNSTIYTYRLKSEVKDMIDKPRIGLVIGDGYKTPKEVIDGDGVEQYAMNSISWKAIQELHRKIKRLEERLEYENIT